MAGTPMVKVMLVDDHEIVREGLREVLEGVGEFEVVGQAADGQMAVEMASELQPDVVVMDLIMPVKNGIDACREIMDQLPSTRVLVLTMSTEQDAVVDSLAAGATGYLQKVCGRQEFLSVMRDVAAGEFRIPSDAMRRVLAGIRSAPRPSGGSTLDSITDRERALLALFARGQTYAADRRGKRHPAHNGAQRHLRNPAEVGVFQQAGAGRLGGSKRFAGCGF